MIFRNGTGYKDSIFLCGTFSLQVVFMDITASKVGKSHKMLHSNDGLRASACAGTCYGSGLS